MVSQTIDIERYEPLGTPSQNNPANLRGPGPGTVVVQNGNGTLGVIYTQTKCGLNYAAASQKLGKRFTPAGVNQPAPFAISGIPAGATIEKAFLWAGGSGDGAAQTATLNGPAGTFNYPMAVVGQGGDVCWSYSGTYAYRADVTTAVNGNGTYNISGLLTYGSPTTSNDMNGATLMVIYSDPSASWAGNINISDGTIVIGGGTANYTQPLAAICGTPTNGRAFTIIDDLQMTGFTTTMNGTVAPGTWNWWNYFDVSTTFTTGQTNSSMSIADPGDCYAVMGYGTYYQNSNCISCSSLTITSTPPVCGQCNGTASVAVSPAGAYTYTWSPSGGNSASATGLCAGNYTVAVKSGTIIQTKTVSLVNTTPTITAAVAQTSVTCFGACTAASTLTPSGGTSPYSYTWSPSGGNSATASGLCAGTYSVIVKDANTCSITKTLSIIQASSLTATTSQANVLCNGGSTGSASVSVTGGAGSYSYTWAPAGGNAAGATGLAAGNYTVTIKDANNCTITSTIAITQPAVLTSTPTQTNVLCNGGTTGTASASVSGGTGAYTYTWSPSGGNAASATGLTSGNYTVAIKDANNCSITNTFIITQPSTLTTVTSQANVLCNGGATGSASVSPSGGTGAYSYTWNPSGGNAAGATGLLAGTYTVTIKDANNCTTTRTVAITQPVALTAVTSQTNALCNGAATGAGSVTVSNGTSPYTYTWNPTGGNASNASGLTAGIYTVQVKDVNNCLLTTTLNITQPASLTAITSQTNVSCNGGSNGTASVSVSGGTGAYSYTWNPTGGNTSSATGLGIGTYTVAIKDANLCALTSTLTIAQPSSLTAVTSQTNNTCGNTNGSASVSVTGGTGTYSYTWSPSGGNAATTTTLATGNYTVTIRDANNCIQTASVSILQSAQFTVTVAGTSVTCNGLSNGSASLTVSGGSAPYSYTWNPTGGNGAIASGLPAGTYTVNIRDLIGCTSNTIITITQPASLTAITSQTNVLCNGGNTGSASVSVSGGNLPYSYTWSPAGGNASTASSLTSGTYTVSVSDANSCSLTRTLTITQPAPLSSTITHTDVSCNGGANGVANVSVLGGTTPYSYTWSPTGGNASTAPGLAAGNYSVLVKDANLCTLTASVTIAQPGQFTVTASSTSISCNGQSTGSGTVNVSGGTSSYTYTWSPAGGNNATAAGLATGVYTVNIKDANNCSTTKTITISEPTLLTATTTQTNVGCFGQSTGFGNVNTAGGTSPYTYTWSPAGGNNALSTGLTAGTYSVMVMDANSCSLTRTIAVTQPASLTSTPSQTNVFCTSGTTGAANVSISGGTGAYTYTWLPSGGNNPAATNLSAGLYTVMVQDANSCNISQTYTVTEPGSYTITAATSSIACFGGTGSATVSVAGGAGSYTYTWSPSGGNASNASGLTTGNYSVTIKDANNCPATQTLSITQSTSVTAVTSQTNVSCNSGANGSASVTVNGGTLPYTYTWTPSGGNTALATGLVSGSYSVTVQDGNSCTSTSTVFITQPTQFTVTAATTSVTCFGQSTGSATLNVSGSTVPYTYTWSPAGGNASIANSLAAGNYFISIKDVNFCPVTYSLNITEPTALTATTSQTDVPCSGSANGIATVSASGGTSPYTYTWSPIGGNSNTATSLSPDTYSILVQDANTCSLTKTITISEASQFTVAVTSTSISCFGQSTGSGTVSISGGTFPYTYTWSPSGGNAATAANLAAGIYSVAISDVNNCTTTKTLSIIEPALLTASTTQTNVGCFGQNTGLGEVIATGGTAPYTYTWVPTGGNNASSTGLMAGNYTVMVSDANSCSLTSTITVTQPASLTATPTQTNLSCNASGDGIAQVNIGGGTLPYTYTWSPAGGNASTAANLAAGNYTVMVQDANSCGISQTYTVTEPLALSVIGTQTNVSCNGLSNGQISSTVTGGTLPYSYTWSPTGGNGANATGLSAGSYTVAIKDFNNCGISYTAQITEPLALTASITQTNVSCNNLSNGSASVTINGGTIPYTYTWSPSGGNAPGAANLAAGLYSVTIEDLNLCALTSTVPITEPTQYTLTAGTSSVNCFGQSTGAATVNVSGATGPYTYTWSPSGGNASTANGLAAGNYTINIKDARQCATTWSLSIVEPTALSSVMTHTDVSCNGASNGIANASISGGISPYTYTWSPVGGNASTATGIPAGTYSVLMTDANSCQLSNTVTVSEASQFTITTSSSSVTCFGLSNGSASVNVTGGTLPYSYTWSPTGGNAATASALSAGTYSVLINDVNLCNKTVTISVAEPTLLTAVTSQTGSACYGSNNGSAAVTASGGTGAYSYSWSPAISTNSTVSSLAPGNYSVTVSDINLCSVTKTLTITEPSQYTVTASTNSVLCHGQSTGSATVSVSGNTPSYTYTWFPSGGNSSTATGLSTGNYTVNILDLNSCAATQTLTIAEPTSLTGSISASAANCGNADGSATVTVNGGQTPYTYTWSPSGGNAAVSTGVSTGSYTCSILDINNCPLSLSASVAVINPSVTLASPNYSICSGNSTSLFANGSNSYTWNPSGNLSSATGSMVTATPTITTTYTVTGANAFGCLVTNTITIYVYANPVILTSASSPSICAGKTTTLSAGGASTYTWNPAATLSNPNSSSPVATPLNTQTYSVIATNSLGCTGTATITITVQQLPTVSAVSNPSALCLHQTATLTANGAATYTWSTNATGTTLTVSPSANTVYTVTGRDANGCVNSGTVPVTVNQPPVVTINSVSSICQGQSATLNATGASTYTWNTTSTSAAITVTPSTTTSYTVIGTNANGCKDTSSYTINVTITPTLSISGPSVVCSADEITLIASGGNNGYTWNTGDVTPDITYSFTSGAVLTVSSGISPCIGSASHTVIVNPLPVVTAIASPTDIIIGQTSQLSGTGNGSYQWYPTESLSCNTCPNPVAQPSGTTVYTVEVTDANGCKNFTTVLVNVEIVCGELFAPSAFSPNGDGNNETWTVYGNCIETIQCDIFNRWGQKVFSITKHGDAWDGTLNGVPQNSGVFIYQVNATFINGDVKSQKGNFTLVK